MCRIFSDSGSSGFSTALVSKIMSIDWMGMRLAHAELHSVMCSLHTVDKARTCRYRGQGSHNMCLYAKINVMSLGQQNGMFILPRAHAQGVK